MIGLSLGQGQGAGHFLVSSLGLAMSFGAHFPTGGHLGGAAASSPSAGGGGGGAKHSFSVLAHLGCLSQAAKSSLVGQSSLLGTQIGGIGRGHPSSVFGASSILHIFIPLGQRGFWHGLGHFFPSISTNFGTHFPLGGHAFSAGGGGGPGRGGLKQSCSVSLHLGWQSSWAATKPMTRAHNKYIFILSKFDSIRLELISSDLSDVTDDTEYCS